MSEEEEIMDYEEDYANEDNINIDEDNVFEGKYEFLTKDEMDKERDKKIEEFIQYSDLPKAKAELVLMNNNWNIDILMNDWYDKMQKIKEISGIIQTKASAQKLKEYFKTNKIIKDICPICEIDRGAAERLHARKHPRGPQGGPFRHHAGELQRPLGPGLHAGGR